MTVKQAVEYLKQLPQDLEIQHFYDSNLHGKFDGFAYIADKNPSRDPCPQYNQPKYSVIPISDEYRMDLKSNNRFIILDMNYD